MRREITRMCSPLDSELSEGERAQKLTSYAISFTGMEGFAGYRRR
jgi:hypothetical protein